MMNIDFGHISSSFHMDVSIYQDDQKWIDETKEKPDLNIFDRRAGRETARDSDVDRGEDHHTGDVDSDDVTKEFLSDKIVGNLVNNVH